MLFQSIINLTQICYELGVRQVVTCPGSRSAPLTLAFTRNPNLETLSVNDERAAGFIALGMAQGSGKPVALVCTSGTAPLNLAPAVAEAYYQHVPLALFTADRPPEWTDQWDGQTIRQDNIYGSHVKGFFKLPTDLDHPDTIWQVERMTSEALNISQDSPPGPIHINCPFREPFYPGKDEVYQPDPGIKVIRTAQADRDAGKLDWDYLSQQWSNSKRKLLVIGQNPVDFDLSRSIEQCTSELGLPVISDILSNQRTAPNTIHSHDSILMAQGSDRAEDFAADMVISIGKSVISKNFRLFIRKNRPVYHWHISDYPEWADPFQSLTLNVRASPATFLKEMKLRLPGDPTRQYLTRWQEANNKIIEFQQDFFQDSPFSEFHAVRSLMQQLPEGSSVHWGNSMPVRYANFLAEYLPHKAIGFFGNRGTSGIDGCLSAAVGHALTTTKPVISILGDVSFIYDRNALWHRHKPNNLKIVVLNNRGGGIFRMIPGPVSQPELEKYFVGSQDLTAENTANDYKLAYFGSDNLTGLCDDIPAFLKHQGSAVLEVFTNPETNTETFNRYKASIQKL